MGRIRTAGTAGPVGLWLLLIGLTTGSPALAQYQFTPTGGDDGAAFQQALRLYRHVQVAGPVIRLDTPVQLEDDHGYPLHNVVVEPAPGIPFVTVRTAITRNEEQPTDPSRAVFNYNGRFREGSFLLEPVPGGATRALVRHPSGLVTRTGERVAPFEVGNAVCLNTTSGVTDARATVAVNTNDGALESVVLLDVQDAGEDAQWLTFDRPMSRAHVALASVVHCAPLRRPTFRHLIFESTGDAEPRVGIHMHVAQHAELTGIRSERWRGFSLILLDSGGRNNVIRDCFAQGVGAGNDWPNGWGLAVEGQEGTLIINSGASRFSEGIVINYSMDTWAYGVRVEMAGAASLDLSPDHAGNPSVRSGFVGGRVWGGGLGALIGAGCVDCRVDVQMAFPYGGVLIGPWTVRPVVQGRIFWPDSFGVALSLLYGGPGDGASTATDPVIDALTSCHPARFALVRGPSVVPTAPVNGAGFYRLGPAMQACSPWVTTLP